MEGGSNLINQTLKSVPVKLGVEGLTNNIQNTLWLFQTLPMPILKRLCNFTPVSNPSKGK